MTPETTDAETPIDAGNPTDASTVQDAAVNDASDRTTTPEFVVTADGDLLGEDSASNRELVRRIKACVNACDGLTTADLEAGIVRQMTTLVAELTPLLSRPQTLRKAS